MAYVLYWKGKRLSSLGTFKTKEEAETARGIEMTQMELAEYSPAQLKKYLTIKKLDRKKETRNMGWKKLRPPADVANDIKSKYTTIWMNRKKNLGLVFEDYEHLGTPSDLNFPYSVTAVKLKEKSYDVVETIGFWNFRTKSKALNFAKKWMREH